MDIERIEIQPASRSRMTIEELSQRLGVGKKAIYKMLQLGKIPSIRGGEGETSRFIVTRHAFEQWEKTCGMRKAS